MGSSGEEKLDLIVAEIQKMNKQIADQKLQTDSIGQELMKLKYGDEEEPNSNGSFQRPPIGSLVRKEDEIKLQELPEFSGALDAEEYLDWERRVERIFYHKQLTDSKRFTYATLKLSKYASAFFEQLQIERARDKLPKLDSWAELKLKLRRKFVPRNYRQDMFLKLNNLRQNNLSIEQYMNEFDKLSIACDIKDEEEQRIARFVSGLNYNIRKKVELQTLYSVEDACAIAVKVEKSKAESKPKPTRGFFKQQTETYKSYDNNETPNKEDKSASSSSSTPFSSRQPKLPPLTPTQAALKNKTCFKCYGTGHISSQCPNRNLVAYEDHMALVNYYQAIKAYEKEEKELTQRDFEEKEKLHVDAVIQPTPDVDTLLIRRTLHVDPPKEDSNNQRHTLFHSRCEVKGRSCSLIVDGGSCTNVASQKLVDTLNLETSPHPQPYKLSWLSDKGTLWVNKQVLVTFSMGEYEDNVLCDVLPMTACSLLFGRPWQFDKDAIHHGRENVYTIAHGGRRLALQPLPLHELARKEAPKSDQGSSTNQQNFVAFYEAKEMNKHGKKHEKENPPIAALTRAPFDVGDYVWLSLDAQKLHHKLQGKENDIEEGPFKVVHRENYDTFQILLGKGVCASFKQEDLVPCFDNT